MERGFVEHMATTGDAVYSAAKAGYAVPESKGYILKAKPAVQEAIGRRVMEKLAKLGDKAVLTVEMAMDSTTSTWTNKLMAADMVLKRLEKSDDMGGKEPSEMTSDEIAATIRALELRQSELAKDVTPIAADPKPGEGIFG